MLRSRSPRSLQLAAVLVLQLSPPAASPEELPPGVEQIIPRGAIPAVFEPHFVDAAGARIPDDAWVLGVSLNGQSRAYSLNLLNSHEIVNDAVGNTAFAAVW